MASDFNETCIVGISLGRSLYPGTLFRERVDFACEHVDFIEDSKGPVLYLGIKVVWINAVVYSKRDCDLLIGDPVLE